MAVYDDKKKSFTLGRNARTRKAAQEVIGREPAPPAAGSVIGHNMLPDIDTMPADPIDLARQLRAGAKLSESARPRNMVQVPDIRNMSAEDAIALANSGIHLIPSSDRAAGGFMGGPRNIQ